MPPATRAATSKRLPDFFIIGAMKAGTTTLYSYLARHPGVYLSTPKEPMFFSRDEVYARGLDWYRGLFAEAEADQVCGEASTCYSRAPHYSDVPSRIAALLPRARLVYILRHPVERAYSHYRWDMQNSHLDGEFDSLSFSDALEKTSEYVDASSYIRQIERYTSHFDREQLLVLTLDDLRDDPGSVLTKCQEFIGVEPLDLVADGAIVANPSDGQRVARYRVRKSVGRMRRLPVLRQVINALPRRWRRGGRRRVEGALASSGLGRRIRDRHRSAVAPLEDETRARLLEQLAGPTRELEEYLGRRLPSWFV